MYFSRRLKLKLPIFKKRGFIYSKKHISILNKSAIYSSKVFLELNKLRKVLIFMKRLVKKKFIKVYINLQKNHFFSSKAKNTRMGKGKGRFKRYVYRNFYSRPIVYFDSITNQRFTKIKFFF